VDTIDQLLAGELDRRHRPARWPNDAVRRPQPVVLFPGSFNPMHEGHVLLARVAEEQRQQPLAFEISVTNVDKPPPGGRDGENTGSRNSSWKSHGRTHASPHLPRKVALVPSTTFVIGGGDTAERLVAAEILWR